MGEDLIFGHFIEDLTVDEGKLEGKEAKKGKKKMNRGIMSER